LDSDETSNPSGVYPYLYTLWVLYHQYCKRDGCMDL
jgi:hypothetical protein